MYQQEKLFKKLLVDFPEFTKIGTVKRQPYEKKPGRGRPPKQTEHELVFVPVNKNALLIAENPGVYIFVKTDETKDFYIGHAGIYESGKKGFLGRFSKYKAGLNQETEDTNRTLAEHFFSKNFEVFFAPNPQATYKGELRYFGEDLETLLIREYNPILNKRNR